MARHVDPEDDSFRRSLLRAAGGGLLALVVTFGITAVLTQIDRPSGTEGPVVSTSDGLAEQPSPQPEPAATASAATPAVEPSIDASSASDSDGVVTVQVLDAVGSGTHAEDAAEVLRELGYEVVVVNSTPRRVETTTVLVTPGHEADAAELAAVDPRFAQTGENLDFNPEVDLHILVAADFVEP